MSIKKQYLKTKSICKVTFKLANRVTNNAKQVNLVGEFNNWDVNGIPMRKNKNGEYTASLDLEKGREYQFRYLIDGHNWYSDPEADRYEANVFQSENAVVVV